MVRVRVVEKKKWCGCGCGCGSKIKKGAVACGGCGSKYFKVLGTGAVAVEEIKKSTGSGEEIYQRTVIYLVRPAFGFQTKAVTV